MLSWYNRTNIQQNPCDALTPRGMTSTGGTDMTILTDKRCPKCGDTKSRSEFYKDRTTADGLSTYCQICKKAKEKLYGSNNKELISTRNKAHYASNQAEMNGKVKAYYHENKPAILERRKEIRDNDVDRFRNENLKHNYGISLEQYNEMLDAQGGVCAVCGKPETAKSNFKKRTKVLAVDHDHETGEIRGLLCNKCNTAIGLLNDDISLFDKATRYLMNWLK